MKRQALFSTIISVIALCSACSSSKDAEIERLKAENAALKASQQTETTAIPEIYIETTMALIKETESETTTSAQNVEEQAQKLVDSFTSHLSTFYKNVEVTYDSNTNYFYAIATVENAEEYLNPTYVYEWSNFVDAATERYATIRDAITAKIPKAKLKLSLLNETDNSEMLTMKGNTIIFNALNDVYAGNIPGVKGNSNASSTKMKKATKGEENALKSALNYLDVMPFSYNGLIDQLEFDKYSHSEAVYAADNCGANWNEQAVKKAKNYLDIMSYSRDGLIDQLVFEGFTQEQAKYGVDAVY